LLNFRRMTMKQLKMAIGCDHAGYEMKEFLKDKLAAKGVPVEDFGTHSTSSVDYPDYVHPLADSIQEKNNDFGILICGSANGVAITANKHAHIRAALCWREEVATLARQHNDANVICLPARFITNEEALKMVTLFMETDFEGGRHATRVNKIEVPC
jgi:ribose 5-phosphate isomerase B